MFQPAIIPYFKSLKPPKGTQIQVGHEIVLVSSNANPYLIGFYGVMVVVTFMGAVLSGFYYFLLLELVWAGLIYYTKIAKSTITFTPKEIIIQENRGGPSYRLAIADIEKVVFKGVNIRKNMRKSDQVSIRFLMKSGKEIQSLTGTMNQKFLFRVMEYFVVHSVF